jgi:hypothetical protein
MQLKVIFLENENKTTLLHGETIVAVGMILKAISLSTRFT